MSDSHFTSPSSEIQRFFRIVRIWFTEAVELMLAVKPRGNGRRCPHCGRRCRLVKSSPMERRWRDLVVCGTPIWLVYQPREVLCPTHGRHQEEIPWARPHSHMTSSSCLAIAR